jgi:ABC-type glycerol-3-phosphate transport system permease component
MAAYALARIPFKFSRAILLGIIATRMIPEVDVVAEAQDIARAIAGWLTMQRNLAAMPGAFS